MANAYKHKRYFRIKVSTSNGGAFDTDYVFQSVADANTKIGFSSVFNTSSPIKTEVLEDDNKTLAVTYEFDSEANQTAFKEAIDAEYTGGTVFSGNMTTLPKGDLGISVDGVNNLMIKVEHFKTDWLHDDGSVSATTSL